MFECSIGGRVRCACCQSPRCAFKVFDENGNAVGFLPGVVLESLRSRSPSRQYINIENVCGAA